MLGPARAFHPSLYRGELFEELEAGEEVPGVRGPYGRLEGRSGERADVSMCASMLGEQRMCKEGRPEAAAGMSRLEHRRCANARAFVRSLCSASVSAGKGRDRRSIADVHLRGRVGDVGARAPAVEDAKAGGVDMGGGTSDSEWLMAYGMAG